jgi:NAD(P)H-dependent FMN reductase
MSPGGARAASVLRGVCAELGLIVVPKQFTLQAPWSAIGDDGHFVEPIKQRFLDEVIDEAALFARLHKQPQQQQQHQQGHQRH